MPCHSSAFLGICFSSCSSSISTVVQKVVLVSLLPATEDTMLRAKGEELSQKVLESAIIDTAGYETYLKAEGPVTLISF